MYREYFGLATEPFLITPDTDFFFRGGKRGAILSALRYAVLRGEGILKITGEVGSGKTLLCRKLERDLPEQVIVVYFANPSLPATELAAALAHDLGITPAVDDPILPHTLQQRLQHHLINQYAEGRRVLLIVEEAQAMPLDTLEQIRLLTNLETSKDKLLQILLVGQPELDEHLKDHRIRQLRERITHSFFLPPLSRDETLEYLNWRLEMAGYRGPPLFPPPLGRKIASITQGLIRRANILADKALLAAFARQTRTLSASLVATAAADCEFRKNAFGFSSLPLARVTLLLVALACLVALTGWYGYRDAPAVGAAVESRSNGPPPTPISRGPLAHLTVGSPSTDAANPAAADHSLPAMAIPKAQPAVRPANTPGFPLLQQRLEATRERLSLADNWGYSIQIMTLAAEDRPNLERFLRKLDNNNPAQLEQLFLFTEPASDGKTRYSITYGRYLAKHHAVEASQRVADQFSVKNPFPRSMQGMKTAVDIAAGNVASIH